MSRIFISHSSANNAAALALANWLEANGWGEYFLDFDANQGIRTGERWMDALKSAADRCEAVLCLISTEWLKSDMCRAEFHLANFLGKRIFGVLVETIPISQLPDQMTSVWQLCDLTHSDDPVSFTVEKLPTVSRTLVHFPHMGLEALKIGLKNAGLDASTFIWPPENQPDRSPYPGLLAFDEPDAAIFFGREASIVRAIDQLRLVRERDVEQLFVILGASGAGKSSFLRAGLLPRLKRDSDHFRVLPAIRPENKAISGSHGLLNSLEKLYATSGKPMSRAQVREQLASIDLAGILREIQSIRQRVNPSAGPSEPTFILPIDQAEELFATDGQEESRAFLEYIDALRQSRLSTQPDAGSHRLRILLVLTIRSDSLPKLQDQPILQQMSPVLFSLPAMPVSEFKAVIEGPARRHSQTALPLHITSDLTDQLIRDAEGADALPLLAFTLERLYREFTTPKGTQIGCGEYQKIGGVRGIIGAAVEHAFEDPDRKPVIPGQREEQERLLRQVFPYIATVDPDTGNWKRRVALRENLRQDLSPQADALVSRLIEQRLLLTDTRPVNDGGTPVEVIEVAHEALLRQWEMLERWLREFAETLSVAELIRRSANYWNRNKPDEGLLVHTGHRLDAAEAVFSDRRLAGRFEPVDGEYLAACRRRDRQKQEEREKAQQEREKHLQTIAEQQATKATLQRRVAWGLLIVVGVVLVGVAWSVKQTREVSIQKSLVLANAAENAANEKLFNQSLRLAVLATKESWPLRPAHPVAAAVLARAADATTLRTKLVVNVLNKDEFSSTRKFISARLSLDGSRAVTVLDDYTTQVWNTKTNLPEGRPMKHYGRVIFASFSPEGRRVVTVSDKEVQVWDVETGKPVGEPMKHYAEFISASFSPDGRWMVTAASDGTAQIWEAATGQPVGVPMKHYGETLSASFSPDGRLVITVSDKDAQVWDAKTGEKVGAPMKHDGAAKFTSFSPDGKRVITASGNEAQVRDAKTGKKVGELMKHDDSVKSYSFSADGRQVVTVSGNKAQVWNAETGKEVGVPMKHDGEVTSASFSPNGRRVVTASGEEAQVWDAETGQEVGVSIKHDGKVTSASFSPDGRWVVTVSDRETQTWNVYWSSFERSDSLVAEVCSKKLSGNIRFITKTDIAMARILEDQEFKHKDVCDNQLRR